VSAVVDCRPVERCVGCRDGRLQPVLELGPQPLANALVRPDGDRSDDRRYPLGIQVCGACQLVQLTHLVDPARLFSSYLYLPSLSTTWLRHCEELAADVCTRARLSPGDLVVEIGSNDGTLLRAFQRRGQRVLGVDPAANIAAQANAAGIPTLTLFFGEATAGRVAAEAGPARAVVSTNVLAHVPDPRDLLRGVRAILAPGGVYVNESPSLREMVEGNQFDTIYHEHVSYLSLRALVRLTEDAGLSIADTSRQPVHGGTLRVAATARGESRPSVRVAEALAEERAALGPDMAALRGFARRVQTLRRRLRGMIAGLDRRHLRLAAYGATAKGNVLMSYCALTGADVRYVVDRNPLKQGYLTPGSRIPIVAPEQLEADPPRVLMLLAWNLADEIRRQLAWFAGRGGRFLIPVPVPRLM
jgi:novobiocin biosynthesis protein NovU/D-mycarose 3-C-methyltransferase